MFHVCTLVKKLVKALAHTAEHLLNRGGIGDHGHLAVLSGKLSSINVAWGVLIDANFEACRAPVNKLDRSLALDCGDGLVDIFGDHISTVEHAAGHVLAVSGVTLHHGVCWLEASIGDLSNRQLLVVGLEIMRINCCGSAKYTPFQLR